jgi:hypothetical protein
MNGRLCLFMMVWVVLQSFVACWSIQRRVDRAADLNPEAIYQDGDSAIFLSPSRKMLG